MGLQWWRRESPRWARAKRSPRCSSALRSASDAQLGDHPSHPLRFTITGRIRGAKKIDLFLRLVCRDGEAILRLIGKESAVTLPDGFRKVILKETARAAKGSSCSGECHID